MDVCVEDIAVGMQVDLEAVEGAAANAFAQADDEWASGAYRSHVATVLARRLLDKVLA
jgi:CO/xanthine dehydrogenase FAD-binding subunit